jgi:hypothetical protein
MSNYAGYAMGKNDFEVNWDVLLFGVLIAGVYERQKQNCLTENDKILLKAVEEAKVENERRHNRIDNR